jgi:predicted alpha/beta-fold hydrolase
MNTIKFLPAWGLKNQHLQTLFAPIFRRPKRPHIEKEVFELEDGDFVDIFWHHAKPKITSNKPIMILFHGLEGSFKSAYIQGMMNYFDAENYDTVIMHFRGCSGRINRLARAYHSGDSADALAWISYLNNKYPQAPLYAVGFSLGGNMLLKMVAEEGTHSVLKAAIAVSAPLQLDICATQMNSGFSKLYQYLLIKELKEKLSQRYIKHDIEKIISLSLQKVKKIKTFWEIDDYYTAPIHGFKSVDDYYSKCSAKQYLKNISIPTLIIHAKDDPFMTSEVIPTQKEVSNSVILEISDYGGHVGFISGSLFKPEYWLEKRIFMFINGNK